LVDACMVSSALTLQCPAGRNTTESPDLITANAVTCRVCKAVVSKDKYPVEGKIMISVQFGPLQSNGVIYNPERLVTDYAIIPLDENFRAIRNQTLQATKVYATPSGGRYTCCKADLYTMAIYGSKPEGFSRIMIVPRQGGVALPGGFTSEIIEDAETGDENEVNGTVMLKFASAAAATAAAGNQKMAVVVIKALAKTIDGVEEMDIFVSSITADPVDDSRRLAKGQERRLAASDVEVAYTILTVEAITAKDISAETFLANLKEAAVEVGASADLISALETSSLPVIGEPNINNFATPMHFSAAAPIASSTVAFIMASAIALVSMSG